MRMIMSKMKVIIFGAGVFGRLAYRALQRMPDEVKIFGFIDNDSKRHGEKYLEKDVFSPTEICSLSFDKVVVAGRHIDQMSRQLTDELFVPDSKIWPMKRSELMATSSEKKMKSAYIDMMLKKLLCVFDMNNISYWMDASGLLALQRGVDLSEFSDVDISIISTQQASVLWEKLKDRDPEEGQLRIRKKENEKETDFTTLGTIQLISMMSELGVEEEPARIDIQVKTLRGDIYLFPYGDGFFYTPKIHFSDFDVIQYKDMALRIPIYSKEYLRLMYGANWETPAEYWGANDYGNIISINQVLDSKRQSK